MSVETVVVSEEKKIGVFLTAHHIVLYVVLAVVLLGGVYLFESKYAAIETSRATAAEQALVAEKDHTAQLTAAFATQEAARQKQNDAFLQGISRLQAQTKVQIIHDTALPAPALGQRIETITGFKQGTVTLDPSQNLIVPLPLGQGIVTLLDQGAADAQTVVQQAGIIKNQAVTITQQAAIIVEDHVVLVAQIDADTKVLNAEKANSRKGKLKWFGIGFVSGYVAGLVTGHMAL